MKYGICKHCNRVIELECSNVGIRWVWHGYCCGWNQTLLPMSFDEAIDYSAQHRLSGTTNDSPKSPEGDF